MVKGYGQYCPLSLAAELLCQRWTLLVVSRLVDGCRTWSEIHRGVPRISPTLLSKRLSELERAGLVERHPLEDGRGHEYILTQAGWDLESIIMDLAVWGQRWARDMTDDDLDPAFLVWSMHTRMNVDAMPPGRTVIEFHFDGAPSDVSRFWIVKRDGEIEMCLKDPELDVDVLVSADLRRFIEAWRGFRDLRREIRDGHIVVEGPDELRKQLPSWLLLSGLAPFERLRAGREQAMVSAG